MQMARSRGWKGLPGLSQFRQLGPAISAIGFCVCLCSTLLVLRNSSCSSSSPVYLAVVLLRFLGLVLHASLSSPGDAVCFPCGSFIFPHIRFRPLQQYFECKLVCSGSFSKLALGEAHLGLVPFLCFVCLLFPSFLFFCSFSVRLASSAVPVPGHLAGRGY